MSSDAPPEGSLHRIRRLPQRGSYDRQVIDAILDEGLVCFVAIAAETSPVVIPMAYGRRGDQLILHGAQANRLLRAGAAGTPLCVTVTLVDGLVLARSAFHHSLNYRSVVLFGVARELTDAGEKTAALKAVVEHLLPGRFAAVRPPNTKELAATRVLVLPIETASAKTRTGGPLDDADDQSWPCWAGEIPLALTARPARPTTQGTPPGDPPASVRDYQPDQRFVRR